jgi:hypothetical protein
MERLNTFTENEEMYSVESLEIVNPVFGARSIFRKVVHSFGISDKGFAEQICEKFAKETKSKCFVVANSKRIFLKDFSESP